MPLNHNGMAIEKVNFNNTRMKVVNFNGIRVWEDKQIVYSRGSYGLPMIEIFRDGGSFVRDDSKYLYISAATSMSSTSISVSKVVWWTVDAIDLTPWDTITFIADGWAFGNDGLVCEDKNYFIGFASNSYGEKLTDYTKYVNLSAVTDEERGEKTLTLDISKLTGNFHVGVAMANSNKVDNVNLGQVFSVVIS